MRNKIFTNVWVILFRLVSHNRPVLRNSKTSREKKWFHPCLQLTNRALWIHILWQVKECCAIQEVATVMSVHCESTGILKSQNTFTTYGIWLVHHFESATFIFWFNLFRLFPLFKTSTVNSSPMVQESVLELLHVLQQKSNLAAYLRVETHINVSL